VLRHRAAVVTAIVAVAAATTIIPVASRAASLDDGATTAQTITVNLADHTGPVLHGASGALYGLSENGVPGADLLGPLHIRTIAQGPPDGAQHPSGHADQVASEFFGMGGQWLLDYMQDYYSQWPYQNVGIPSYLTTVDTIVSAVRNSPDASRDVFVPFNEPDWIWYSLNPSASGFAAQMAQFEQDWTTVYQRIRADDPGALIAGPNTSVYNQTVMSDFLAYAKAHGVLPDIITWHVLEPGAQQAFPSDYANFRALERADGISPLPVDIDEYADRYDLSVPGEMVQWLAMFENAKVYADMPFWDIADNYSDTAVRNDEPNGQWWLFDWYGSLTGDTVAVTPPRPGTIDTPQGLAALDAGKKQARVIVADPSGGDDTVAITGISPAIFGSRVHVSVQSIGWTGYDGAAYTPTDVAETDYPVVNGSVRVPLGTADPMTAYQLIVTPASGAPLTAPARPGTQTYLAADASLTDATVYSQGSQSNYNGYATAGGKDVGSIDQPDSRVAFHVTVPKSGRYFLSVYYGNQTEDVAQQIMRVDDGPWSFVSYPPTLNWLFRSHQDMYLNLAAGTHTITFGVSDPSIGTAKGQVTMDDIQLTALPANHGAQGSVPGVTGPGTSYAAAYADLSGGASTVPCNGGGCLAAQNVVLRDGGSVTFAVDAGSDGFYAVSPSGASGTGTLTADGVRVSPGLVYLHAGINPVTYTGAGRLGGLSVTPSGAAGTTYAAAAPGNILSGAAVVQPNQYAYGGADVGYIGDGAANTLTFTGVKAARAGTYRVTVSYADDERQGTGNYNTNLIDRSFTVTTSAGSSETVYARNTYSWDQFDTIEATVRLSAGINTITFGNPAGYAPNIDKITVAPASLP
jgi:carbohydrate binding protein with CBM6 domain